MKVLNKTRRFLALCEPVYRFFGKDYMFEQQQRQWPKEQERCQLYLQVDPLYLERLAL